MMLPPHTHSINRGDPKGAVHVTDLIFAIAMIATTIIIAVALVVIAGFLLSMAVTPYEAVKHRAHRRGRKGDPPYLRPVGHQ